MDVTKGVELIAEARKHQVVDEGFDAARDAQYTNNQLLTASECYIKNVKNGGFQQSHPSIGWPWGAEWWKPGVPIQDLAKAGALIAAEIDRRIAAGEPLE